MRNEPGAERRRAIIAETWTDDASYLDPIMEGRGPRRHRRHGGGGQRQFPGHRFELTAGDAHHDRVRFAWRLVGANGGEPVAAGVDFATLGDDGRLRAVTGFLEGGH
jgi:hypothetical protein